MSETFKQQPSKRARVLFTEMHITTINASIQGNATCIDHDNYEDRSVFIEGNRKRKILIDVERSGRCNDPELSKPVLSRYGLATPVSVTSDLNFHNLQATRCTVAVAKMSLHECEYSSDVGHALNSRATSVDVDMHQLLASSFQKIKYLASFLREEELYFIKLTTTVF